MTAQAPESGKPRLLVATSTYPRWAGDHEPGFVHALARGLCDQFEVMVVCPHAPGAAASECLDGVHVHRYRYAPQSLETLVNDGGIVPNLRRSPWKWMLLPGFLAGLVASLWMASLRWKPDVVHAHWLVPQGAAWALLRSILRRPAPMLVTSHGTDLHALRTRPLLAMKQFVVRRASAITVVSSAMRGKIADLGASMSKVSVLPMGVDLHGRFTPDPAVSRLADELLFVGRLTETKGLRHLIAAMPAILALRPGTQLTVAGFGPELQARQAQAVALGVDHAIHFVGPVRQEALPAFYRRATLLVAPFEQATSGAQEGLGLVLVEAIGCGCPVVTTRQPATGEIFDIIPPAGLAEPGSAESLAAAILSALADPRAAIASATRIRPTVVARFALPAVAGRYAALLSRLMQDTGA